MQEKLVKCPKCGNSNLYNIYNIIDVDKEYYLRKEVLNQSIFKYECKCGYKTQMFYPTLYKNLSKNFMVEFASKSDASRFKNSLDSFGIPDTNFIFRIVTRPFELTEKILVLESGYDDRIIEILKEMILASTTDKKISYLIFARDKEIEYTFLCLDENNVAKAMIPFRKDLYDSVYDMFYSKLNDNTYVIDQDWAREFLCEVNV